MKNIISVNTVFVTTDLHIIFVSQLLRKMNHLRQILSWISAVYSTQCSHLNSTQFQIHSDENVIGVNNIGKG